MEHVEGKESMTHLQDDMLVGAHTIASIYSDFSRTWMLGEPLWCVMEKGLWYDFILESLNNVDLGRKAN